MLHPRNARYDADLTKRGLEALYPGDLDRASLCNLDSIDSMNALVAIGDAVGAQIDLAHFGPFVEK